MKIKLICTLIFGIIIGLLMGFLMNFINYYNENFAGKIKILSPDGFTAYEAYGKEIFGEMDFVVKVSTMNGEIEQFPYVDYSRVEKSMEAYVNNTAEKKILELADKIKNSRIEQRKAKKTNGGATIFIDGKIYYSEYYNDKGDIEKFSEAEELYTYLYEYLYN